jgi:hypothetical protein
MAKRKATSGSVGGVTIDPKKVKTGEWHSTALQLISCYTTLHFRNLIYG